MKVRLYKAVDAIDMYPSYFIFNENDDYRVLSAKHVEGDPIDEVKGFIEKSNWFWPVDSDGEEKRILDMIEPELLAEWEL